MPMADVFAVAVGDDDASRQHHFNVRMLFKKITHGRERAGQILFVAVQIGKDVARVARR